MSSNLKVAVITGAARGIGLTIAQRFHAEEYYTIIIDRDKEATQAFKTELSGKSRYSYFLCDVSNPGQVKSSFDNITSQFPDIHPS